MDDYIFVTAMQGYVRVQIGTNVVMLDPNTAMELSQRLKIMVNQARRQERRRRRGQKGA